MKQVLNAIKYSPISQIYLWHTAGFWVLFSVFTSSGIKSCSWQQQNTDLSAVSTTRGDSSFKNNLFILKTCPKTPRYAQPYFHRVCHKSTRVTYRTITSIWCLKKFHLLSCIAFAQLFSCCLTLRNVLQTHQCCIGTLHKSGSSYL